MGIQGFNTFLRNLEQKKNKASPDPEKAIFYDADISEFSGTRIGIDAWNWLFSNASSAQKKVISTTNIYIEEIDREALLHEIETLSLIFIDQWIRAGVIPVFVFDGKAPKEKIDTQEDRRQKREKIQNAAKTLRKEFIDLDPFDIPSEKAEELRRIVKQDVYVTNSEVQRFKLFISSLGIPWLQATGEAEYLCSMLNIEYKVSAVFSSDTDNIVYGCPMLLNKFVGTSKSMTPVYQAINHESVLEILDLTHEQMVDFAIMCKCDYNTNIPRVGPVNAYKLIKEHGSIDKLPKKYDVSCLRHEICRNLFKERPSKELIKEGSLDFDMKKVRSSKAIATSLGHGDDVEYLTYLICNTPVVEKEYIYNPKTKEYIEIKIQT